MPAVIKTRTTVYNILSVFVDWFVFDEDYRKIRGHYKYKGFKCFNCNRGFEDGEPISLMFSDKGNKTVCHDCAVGFKKELKEALGDG